MIKATFFKRIFNKKNIILPLLLGVILYLTSNISNNSFENLLLTSFFQDMSLKGDNFSLLIIIKWFLHKTVLLYLILDILCIEKRFFNYELIRFKHITKIIIRKIAYILVYTLYYYISLIFVLYILHIFHTKNFLISAPMLMLIKFSN